MDYQESNSHRISNTLVISKKKYNSYELWQIPIAQVFGLTLGVLNAIFCTQSAPIWSFLERFTHAIHYFSSPDKWVVYGVCLPPVSYDTYDGVLNFTVYFSWSQGVQYVL